MDKLLVWDVTDKCNLRCKHCYNADMYFNKKVNALSVDDKIEMIKKIANNGFKYLSLLGGEPLACEDLDLILKTAKDNNLKVFITTNGTLMSRDIIDMLVKNEVYTIVVSIDGATAESNDNIRGVGSFERATENLRNLNKLIKKYSLNMQTGISTTLTKKNRDDLINMPKLAHELGVDKLIFSTFVESGNGDKNIDEFQYDYNKIQDVVEEIAAKEIVKYPNLSVQLDMRPYLTQYLKRKYKLKNVHLAETFVDCLAGEEMWYMTADGDIHPCNIMINQKLPKDFPKDKIKIEKVNIREYESLSNFENNIYFNNFNQVKKDFTLRKTCINCDLKGVCTPCPIQHINKSTINECEYIMKKEHQFIENILDKSPTINDEVIIKNNQDMIVLWNSNLNKIEKLSEIKKEIIEMVQASKTIKEIGIEISSKHSNINIKNDIYNYLLDLRLNDYIDF